MELISLLQCFYTSHALPALRANGIVPQRAFCSDLSASLVLNGADIFPCDEVDGTLEVVVGTLCSLS